MEWLQKKARQLRREITLEPMIICVFIASQITGGSGVGVELIFLKVCRYELGFNETICNDLKNPAFEAYEIQVQKTANNFEIYRGMVTNLPVMFYCLIVGALADRFGRKPLMIVPLIGQVLKCFVPIVLYTFIEHVPIEFFILEGIHGLFGGLGVYFVGVYAYGATITSSKERSTVLARYDGVESLSQILGTWLGVAVFSSLGFYGNYSIKAVFNLLALLYVSFLVKEPAKRPKATSEAGLSVQEEKPTLTWTQMPKFFITFIIQSIVDTYRTYFKKRDGKLRLVILVQLFIYACYKFAGSGGLTYLYMKRAFGAEGKDYALLRSGLKALQAFALLVLVPLFRRFRLHDAIIVGISTVSHALAMYASALAPDLYTFILTRWATMMRMVEYGAGRALMSRSVDPDEVGKAMGGYTIVSSFVPYFANIIMRSIYGLTLETMPNFFMFISASWLMLASGLNFWLYTQRSYFRKEARPDESADDVTLDQ